MRHQPGVEILAADAADGDDLAVAISVARLANHCLLPNVIGESEGRLLTAAVSASVSSFAVLPDFRGVDAEQPNALAVDLDNVAFNDGCATSQIDAARRSRSQYDDYSKQ